MLDILTNMWTIFISESPSFPLPLYDLHKTFIRFFFICVNTSIIFTFSEHLFYASQMFTNMFIRNLVILIQLIISVLHKEIHQVFTSINFWNDWLQSLLKPWAKSVTQSLILIDSEMPEDEEPLDSSAEEKPTKKKGGNRGLMELTPPKVFKVDILDPLTPVLSPSGLNDMSGNIRFSGTLAGLSFVHSKVRFCG